MSSSDLLVITAASGQQARRLLASLTSTSPNLSLRLICHSAASATRLRQLFPNAEVLTGDLSSPSFCTDILRDATAFYHIGPPFHHAETAMGLNLVTAAKLESTRRQRFRHFVYSSAIHPIVRKMLNHDAKRYVEEALVESGLPFTILQPTHFMDIIPVGKYSKEEREKVVHTMNWNPAVEFSFVALSDLGEAGAKVLAEGEKHYYAIYELCGTGPVSYNEVCRTIGEHIKKEVEIKKVPYDEAVNAFLEKRFGEDANDYNRDAAERMLLYYNRRGIVGNPNVLGWLLGRKPLGIAEWVQEHI